MKKLILLLLLFSFSAYAKDHAMVKTTLCGGMSLGGSSAGFMTKMNVGASLFGYGTGPEKLVYRLVQLGFDFSPDFKRVGLHLIPISFHANATLMPHTYVGPGIGFDTKGVNAFVNVSLAF